MPNPIASIGRRRGLFCRRSPSIFLLHNSKIPNPVNDHEHSLPLPDRFYISSGEGVVTVINAWINIVDNGTEERVLRGEEFPIRANEVYSPLSGVHNGSLG